jgi:lipopolysaccharide/colanic/teichoic acid biosynthesis glycosyltransferase
LGKELQSKLPYYSVRTLVSPGLSGWAQVSQDYAPQSLEETRLRLAYDFYYIKNRSIALECSIILKTIRTLLSRVGV